MKRLKFTLSFLIGILCIVSCKKGFLDQTGETTFLYREKYIKDLGGMTEYLNGIYLQFNKNWASGAPNEGVGYPELMADNLKPAMQFAHLVAIYKWAQQPQGSGISNPYFANMTKIWEGSYQVIRTSSFLIEDIGKYRSENPERADYLEGQALVFRALMHFKLVNVFAQPYNFTDDASHYGIPYITISDVSQTYTRQTVKEVYDKIVADLIRAIDLMKVKSNSDILVLNQDVAKAILSRVYLFKGDYINSLKLAKELCVRHPLMTIAQGYPDGMYSHKSPAETEVLFQASPAEFPSPETKFIGMYSIFYNVTNDLADILTEKNSDVRSNWVTKTGENWSISKFPAGVAGIITNKNGDYYDPVIRSSELFLMAAEASAKTGDEVNARLYLNQLRKRADPNATDLDFNGVDLLDAIYKERRKELCFENLRLFDLMRLKMDVNRGDVFDNAPKNLPYGSDHLVSPIPKKEIDIMGLKPNPGY